MPTTDKKSYNREYAKRKREERKAANLCPECGKAKDTAGYRCSECTNKNNERSKQLDKNSLNEYRKERLHSKIAAGICTMCPNQAAAGYQKCLECRDKSNKARNDRQKEREAKGLCSFCDKAPLEGSTLCQRHYNKRVGHKVRHQENVLDAGLCTHCKTAKADEGYKSCTECRTASSQYSKQQKERKLESGLCTACSSPELETDRVCRRCYLKTIASSHGLTTCGWVILQELWDKQQGLCRYSKVPLKLGVNASLDHIIPISKGGTSDPSNLQWTSKEVNIMKRDFLEDEFINLLKTIVNNFTETLNGDQFDN